MSAEKQQFLQEVMIERFRELCHEEDRAEKHEVALPEAILERLDQRLTDVGQGLLLE